jgi:hypothetical protein
MTSKDELNCRDISLVAALTMDESIVDMKLPRETIVTIFMRCLSDEILVSDDAGKFATSLTRQPRWSWMMGPELDDLSFRAQPCEWTFMAFATRVDPANQEFVTG